ncbi:MAG: ROK family protein [Candidatus Atribacteria bacterium]|nr:ROK family protein [Candidatus Atribacteria bacterium]
MAYSIGIDLGGTKIAGVLVNEQMEILAYEKIPVEPKRQVEKVFNDIISLIQLLKEKLKNPNELIGMGIACPGLVDIVHGMMVYSENLNWRNVPVVQILSEKLNFPFYLEHDVRSGAIAEVFFGVGKKSRNLVYISVGTGISGTLIWERQFIRGTRGISAELGHIIVEPGGPLCRCGNAGCLEALASGSAMEREAYHLTKKPVSGAVIMQKAQENISPYTNIVHQAAYYLGIGLANIAQIFDPELIVLGGGVSESGDFLLKLVESYYIKHQFWSFSLPDLKIGAFKGKASVMGAAGLPFLKKEGLL